MLGLPILAGELLVCHDSWHLRGRLQGDDAPTCASSVRSRNLETSSASDGSAQACNKLAAASSKAGLVVHHRFSHPADQPFDRLSLSSSTRRFWGYLCGAMPTEAQLNCSYDYVYVLASVGAADGRCKTM